MPDVPDAVAAGSPALLDAYLRAVYVRGAARNRLVIGEVFSPAPRRGRVHALLTACNPCSRPLAPIDNAQRMDALRARLRESGIAFEPAKAQAPEGTWQEASVWLPNVEPHVADAIASDFEQNAFVRVGGDGVIRLRIMRPDWREFADDDPRFEWPGLASP